MYQTFSNLINALKDDFTEIKRIMEANAEDLIDEINEIAHTLVEWGPVN